MGKNSAKIARDLLQLQHLQDDRNQPSDNEDEGKKFFALLMACGAAAFVLCANAHTTQSRVIGNISHVFSINALNDGGALVLGDFLGTLQFGTNPPLRSDGFDHRGITLANAMFIAKINTNGVWEWSVEIIDLFDVSSDVNFALQEFGPQNYGIGVHTDNSALVLGIFNNTIRIGAFQLSSPDGIDSLFVAKIDPNGNWIWAKSISNIQYTGGGIVAMDGGNWVFAGRSNGTTVKRVQCR